MFANAYSLLTLETTPQHYETTQVNHIQNRKRLREQVTRQQQDIKILNRKPRNNGRSSPYMKHLKIKPINTTRYSTGNTRHTSTKGEDDME
jgi:hypothetical protein